MLIAADKLNSTDAWDDHPEHHNQLARRANSAISVENYLVAAATVLDGWQAALEAAQTTGQRIVCKTGEIYDFDEVAADGTAGLRIDANKPPVDIDLCGSTIRLSEDVPTFTVNNKTGDHQTFTFGWLRNGWVDANNVVAGSMHVVAGTHPVPGTSGAGKLGPANGTNAPYADVQYRTNFDGWYFENLEVINIPYDDNGVLLRKAFGFEVRQAGPGEATQNFARNIRGKNVNIEGGNHGWRILGLYDGATAPYDCNVLIDTDTISIEGGKHDTGHLPNEADGFSPDVGAHIGSLGRCTGPVQIDGFDGEGQCDVFIEVDDDGQGVRNCTATDVGTGAFLTHNFHEDGPMEPGAQIVVWDHCIVRVVDGVPVSAMPFRGWVTLNEADAMVVKERHMRSCLYHSKQTTPIVVDGQAVSFKHSVGLMRLDLTCSFENLNGGPAAPSAANIIAIAPNADSVRATLEGEVRIRLAGAQTTAHKMEVRGVLLGGTDLTTSDLKIDWAHNITGLVSGSMYALRLDAGTHRGNAKVRIQESTGDADPVGVSFAAGLTIDKTFDIWIDGKNAPAGSTKVVNGASAYPTQVRIRGEFNTNPYTATGGSAVPTIPATGVAVSYDRGIPCVLLLDGGTVTSVEISDDASNWRKADGQPPCNIQMEPGLSWRWNGTVAPTAARYLTPTNRVTA